MIECFQKRQRADGAGVSNRLRRRTRRTKYQRRGSVIEAVFPGTVVPRRGKTAEAFFDSLYFATKGLMLLQLREITGLDTPVIQNWIGRGWVQKPVAKRYSADHLARIMLINMLRPAARLESIARILSFLNGDTDDARDDAMPEAKLYCIVCDILDTVDFETVLDDEKLLPVIHAHLSGYREPFPGARARLAVGIRLVLLYYASAVIRLRADRALASAGLASDAPPDGAEEDAPEKKPE